MSGFDNGEAAYSARADAVWTFGAKSKGDARDDEQWVGCLDEIRAYPGVTSAARVSAEYEMVTKGISYVSFRREFSPEDLVAFKRTARVTVKGYAGEPLDDFRLLVRLSAAGNSGFHPEDSAQDGQDVRFFLEDNTVLLSELDTWNPSGESLFWVRVPQLKAGLTLVLRYGSSTVWPMDERQVWSDYTGVWHMNMDAGKTTVAESAHGYNGEVQNVASAQVAAGPVGNAYRHPYAASETVGNMAGVVVEGKAATDAFLKFTGEVTMSFWVKDEGTGTRYGRIWNSALGNVPSATSSTTVGSDLALEGNATHLSVADSGTRASNVTVPTLTEWTQIVLTYGDGRRHVYLNGQEVTAFDNGKASYAPYPTARWVFGAKIKSTTPNSEQWVGGLDEIRAYPGPTSAARIKAEYEMMAHGAGYVTVDEILPVWSKEDLSSFAYRAEFEVSGYEGTETLTNFPLAVRVSSETIRGFKAERMRPDGRDALFVLESGEQLPFEVDTWNPAGESVYWVRVPRLTSGTKIVFYHGRSEAVFNGSGDGVVWPGYAGVWHVNESTDGAVPIFDSSALPIATTGGKNSKATSTGVFGGARGSDQKGTTGPSAFWTASDSKLDLGGAFTVSSWIRRTDVVSEWCYFLTRKSVDASDAWGLQSRHNNVYWLGLWLNGDRYNSPTNLFTMTIDAGTWHKLDVVYDGTDQYIYFDGSQVAHQVSENPAHQGAGGFAAGGMMLPETGGDVGNNAFPGDMDEVRYDGAVRSADWIKAEYQNARVGDGALLSYGRDRKTKPEGLYLLFR